MGYLFTKASKLTKQMNTRNPYLSKCHCLRQAKLRTLSSYWFMQAAKRWKQQETAKLHFLLLQKPELNSANHNCTNLLLLKWSHFCGALESVPKVNVQVWIVLANGLANPKLKSNSLLVMDYLHLLHPKKKQHLVTPGVRLVSPVGYPWFT